MQSKAGKIIISGKPIDDHTRCAHYHSLLDIIAIKFKCCDQYYPCYYCHQEVADHPAGLWKKNEYNTNAIFCGICFNEMSIAVYKDCNYQCPFCNSLFNPECVNHDHFYFEQ
ncbi:MAG: CHY zinc finger protein [Ferruginibacter sp.]